MMSQLRRYVAPTALALMVALPGPALAGAPRTHDGFFLRLSVGGGGANTELDVPGLETEISGTSGDANIAIGGVVAPNLALHGTLFGWSLSDPDVDIEGIGSGEIDGDLSMGAIGGGLTYYFMPANIYVSGSAGLGSLSLDAGAIEGDTDSGFVGEIMLGKEWWVGNSWGLGVAGSLGFHSIPDEDIDENWSGNSWSIRFSATLN